MPATMEKLVRIGECARKRPLIKLPANAKVQRKALFVLQRKHTTANWLLCESRQENEESVTSLAVTKCRRPPPLLERNPIL